MFFFIDFKYHYELLLSNGENQWKKTDIMRELS